MTHDEFLALARDIVSRKGVVRFHSIQSGGVPCGSVVQFKDDRLTITADLNSKALDIEWLNDDGIHNPIVMVDTNGEVFRHHGEWVQAIPHISKLRD